MESLGYGTWISGNWREDWPADSTRSPSCVYSVTRLLYRSMEGPKSSLQNEGNFYAVTGGADGRICLWDINSATLKHSSKVIQNIFQHIPTYGNIFQHIPA